MAASLSSAEVRDITGRSNPTRALMRFLLALDTWAAFKPNLVVVIAGPTAVGKSFLATRLCEQLQGELISVDSMQVYRHLAIGTNKPSAADLARVPHHLLDLCEPHEEYTAGRFYKDALHAVEQVLLRGKVPVLVGGTPMYMRWLVHGMPTAPKSDPVVAEQVRQLLAPFEAAGDWEGGLAKLQQVDPGRAEQLFPNDWYRLFRALTVCLQTEQTAASLSRNTDSDGLEKLRAELDMRCFFLTAPREPLYRRIDRRCESMLLRGLLEETTEQLLSGSLLPSSQAGLSIGYRQAIAYLTQSTWSTADKPAFAEFLQNFTAASRQYAGKQSKWFRKELDFEWLSMDWDVPELAETKLRELVQCQREEFDRALTAPCQTELRMPVESDKDLKEVMRRYIPRFPDTLENPAVLKDLLQRADACRAQLQPRLSDLLAANAEAAPYFPYHRTQVPG